MNLQGIEEEIQRLQSWRLLVRMTHEGFCFNRLDELQATHMPGMMVHPEVHQVAARLWAGVGQNPAIRNSLLGVGRIAGRWGLNVSSRMEVVQILLTMRNETGFLYGESAAQNFQHAHRSYFESSTITTSRMIAQLREHELAQYRARGGGEWI